MQKNYQMLMCIWTNEFVLYSAIDVIAELGSIN